MKIFKSFTELLDAPKEIRLEMQALSRLQDGVDIDQLTDTGVYLLETPEDFSHIKTERMDPLEGRYLDISEVYTPRNSYEIVGFLPSREFYVVVDQKSDYAADVYFIPKALVNTDILRRNFLYATEYTFIGKGL